ncbi:5311_t:CDS:2 [Ambispora gerdemannii]|uniref:Protein-S-isoprenylcysteine O-methyltransferase n=1 Tax=Ambispora gerdemannii TaxID=144530 RepID=A0A9N9HAK9_9GLOM|nr:5311_t:CDS:2 [Ambispora gerdemannii]
MSSILTKDFSPPDPSSFTSTLASSTSPSGSSNPSLTPNGRTTTTPIMSNSNIKYRYATSTHNSSAQPSTNQFQRAYYSFPLLDRNHTPRNIAVYSFLIGATFGVGISVAVGSNTVPQLGGFLTALAFFHIMEYLLTAMVNADKLSMDAFLIHNGISYHIAHTAGLIEFLIELYFFPELKKTEWAIFIGVLLIMIGQTARSLAMWHAKHNFSHQIAFQKRRDHELVTTGIYSILRHPSYFGFFYWAVGTQVLLFNPVCFVGYCVVLHRFFRDRIKHEESLLIKFFGEDYLAYRQRVGVWIPFIK